MKYLIISIIFVPLISFANDKPILSILKIAIEHKLDPLLFNSIIKVESNYKLNLISNTKDYGMTQINKNTAKSFGFNLKRLITDQEYSLRAGAIVLADFQRRYAKQDPYKWYCRYNVGSGKLIGAKLRRCLKYITKIHEAGYTSYIGRNKE